jgi:putative transcriptional regulator
VVINCVRTIAESRGFTVNSLSQKAGVAYNTTRQLWLGYTTRIDFGTLERLCTALNVSAGDLFLVRREDTTLETTKPTR